MYSPIVKEEFFSWLDVPLGVDADTMVSVHHHDLGKAVGVDGMVSKPNLVPLACGVHNVVCRGEKEHSFARKSMERESVVYSHIQRNPP